MTTAETLNAIATLTQTYEATRNVSQKTAEVTEDKLQKLIQSLDVKDVFTEAQLIAFGNYLLNRKTKNKVLQKTVTHADVVNFKLSLTQKSKPKPKK